MRIEIEIPKEFEGDYIKDKFDEFFGRVLCDIKDGTMCGKYENETARMLITAFAESKVAYDVEAMVAELEKLKDEYVHHCIHGTFQRGFIDGAKIATMKAIRIVRNGGKE